MTDRLALPRRYRDQLEALLREHVPGVEVWAYGSRVNGESHDGSDLDLALRGPALEPLDGGFNDLLEAIEKSNVPILVQAHDWATLPESFHREIERDYVVVQEGAKQTTAGEWQTCTLGELTDNFDAIRIPVKETDRGVGPYPYYGASGVVDHVDGFLFDGEYLLIAEDGENLRTRTTPIAFLANGKFWVNNHAHIVQGNSNADTRFLKYALSVLDISGYLTGSTMSKLTQGNMNRIPLITPPLPKQRTIAYVLGTLDDKIELNRRMNRTLEEMAQAIFQDWFVDFGPTRAKMEGLGPYLPLELWDLFPDELVDSELGEIPEGWSLRNFGDLLKDVIGGDWGKESPTPPDTEVVSIIRGTDIPNLRAGGTGSVPRRFTSERKANRRRLEEGDIVIEVSGGSPTTPTGRSMILTTDILERFDGTVVCASFCRRLRPSTWVEGLIASQHLDYLNSIDKMWEYQLQSTGISNFQTKRFLDEEQVIWPDPNIAKAFANVVSPIVKTTNRNENKTIAETRDALLPRLLSGQLATTGNEQTNKGHAR